MVLPDEGNATSPDDVEDTKVVLRIILLVFATLSVLCSFLLSASLIRSHLRHFTRPQEQKKIIGIIWLAPIFAVDALLSLAVPELSPLLELCKESYEAYALYLFFALMVEYLGGEERTIELLAERTEPIYRSRPWRWLWPQPLLEPGSASLAGTFYMSCKRGVMQFVIVRPLMAVVSVVLWWVGRYKRGDMSPDNGYIYDVIIVNNSMVYALVSLMAFYFALALALKSHQPVPKFMAIKAVIFVCFWQGVLLALLAHVHVIEAIGSFSVENVKAGLQDLLVCFEMTFAALYHHYAYPWQPYDRGGAYSCPNPGLPNSVGLEFSLADSTRDFRQLLGGGASSASVAGAGVAGSAGGGGGGVAPPSLTAPHPREAQQGLLST